VPIKWRETPVVGWSYLKIAGQAGPFGESGYDPKNASAGLRMELLREPV